MIEAEPNEFGLYRVCTTFLTKQYEGVMQWPVGHSSSPTMAVCELLILICLLPYAA